MNIDEEEDAWPMRDFIAFLYRHCLIKKPQAIHNGRKPTARRKARP